MLVRQSHPSLCTPMDCSPPASSVHGILQPRILEWVFPSAGDLPDPGVKSTSPALQRGSLPFEPPGQMVRTGGTLDQAQRQPPPHSLHPPTLTTHQLCQGQMAPSPPAAVRLPCDSAHTTSWICFCVGRTTPKPPPGPAHVPSRCWPRGRLSSDAHPAVMSSPGQRPFLPSRMVTADASAENREDTGRLRQ